MRRRLGAGAVLVLLFAVAGALVSAPAGAAPTPTSVPSTCSTYPPEAICPAHIMSSTTTPSQGQPLEVSGRGSHADEDVARTTGGSSVGAADTDRSGNFD